MYGNDNDDYGGGVGRGGGGGGGGGCGGDDGNDVMYRIFSTRWLDLKQFWRRNLSESCI